MEKTSPTQEYIWRIRVPEGVLPKILPTTQSLEIIAFFLRNAQFPQLTDTQTSDLISSTLMPVKIRRGDNPEDFVIAMFLETKWTAPLWEETGGLQKPNPSEYLGTLMLISDPAPSIEVGFRTFLDRSDHNSIYQIQKVQFVHQEYHADSRILRAILRLDNGSAGDAFVYSVLLRVPFDALLPLSLQGQKSSVPLKIDRLEFVIVKDPRVFSEAVKDVQFIFARSTTEILDSKFEFGRRVLSLFYQIHEIGNLKPELIEKLGNKQFNVGLGPILSPDKLSRSLLNENHYATVQDHRFDWISLSGKMRQIA